MKYTIKKSKIALTGKEIREFNEKKIISNNAMRCLINGMEKIEIGLKLLIIVFLFSCKKEVVTPPVIPPTIHTQDSISLQLISGGYCDKENETSIQINSDAKLYLYSIDTTFKIKKGDTVILASWKASFADCTSENWVKIITPTETLIDSSKTVVNGSSETYYSARLELIIK